MARAARTGDAREAQLRAVGSAMESADSATAQPPRFSLLLVDRDDVYARRLRREVERLNGQLHWAEPGGDPLQTLATVRPSALLLSLDDPDTNPLELLQALRTRPEWTSMPVFLVGTRLDGDLELRAYAAGAHAVLRREESLAELIARLRGIQLRLQTQAPLEDAAPQTDATPQEDAAPRAPAPAEQSENGAVPDVIVVEDDPSLQEMLEYSLNNRGYEIAQYSDGVEALRQLQELDAGAKRPVVLLDVDLPGLDGFRILQELADSRPGDFQVIICTMHRSEAAQVLALQSGAVDYLVKPVRVPILIAKLERLLGTGRE